MLRFLTAIILAILPIIVHANIDDDCYDSMEGDNQTSWGSHYYTTTDQSGIKEACKNKFPSWGERFLLKRRGIDAFNATYDVRRSYCWLRNIFKDSECVSWGDSYRADFTSYDIRDAQDSSGSKTLKNGVLPGHHVCLKRFAPGEDMLHGNKNTGGRTQICGYLVYALPWAECRSPVGGWDNAWFGCVEEPLKPSPPTFNGVIPIGIAPYVDTTIKLHDYTDKNGKTIPGYITRGSTFDQPLIVLFNGSKEGGELKLRYRFPGDTRKIDDIQFLGTFPSDMHQFPYQVVVPPEDPSKVCACAVNDCKQSIYVGCVDRPTPKDSNLKLVAQYVEHKIKGVTRPGVFPLFAHTDSGGNILYYDSDGALVAFSSNGTAYKADPKGQPTTSPAKLPLGYKALPKLPIADYADDYEIVDLGASYFGYIKGSITSYGVNFEAVIPQLTDDGVPAFISLDTPFTRKQTDGCGAFKISDTIFDQTKPIFPIPGGDRDRTYCGCPRGVDPKSCPIPPPTACFGGIMPDNEPDAERVYCPGVLKMPSQVEKSNSICLQVTSAWQFVDPKSDKICVQIPTSCEAQPESKLSYGFTPWPEVKPGSSAVGTCSKAEGFEPIVIYKWSPATAITRDKFDCSRIVGDCDYAYTQQYLPAVGYAKGVLQSVQALAHSMHRNLNAEDLEKVQASIGAFSYIHKLEAQSASPERSCDIQTNIGLVKNPCMVIDACGAIGSATEFSGYATWDAPPALTQSEIAALSSADVKTLRRVVQGKCAAGYKQRGTPPSRECYIKYAKGKKVVERWLDVTSPCSR